MLFNISYVGRNSGAYYAARLYKIRRNAR